MKLVQGVGMYTVGKFVATTGGVITKEYNLWSTMLKRCYSNKCHTKHTSYIGCGVSDNFKTFQYFAEWCHKQVGFSSAATQLDKDILIKGNKEYHEDRCVFVPRSLNNFLVSNTASRGNFPVGVSYHKRCHKFQAQMSDGAGSRINLGYFSTAEEAFNTYKIAKEVFAKQLAIKYQGEVDDRVVSALNNFTVEITD